MSAIQGANVIGADSRCASNGTSSLFAFLKVTKPSDVINKPYISFGVKTVDGDRIEPIDSLQKLFDLSGINCRLTETNSASIQQQISMQINPINTFIELNCGEDVDMNELKMSLSNVQGINIPMNKIEREDRRLFIHVS